MESYFGWIERGEDILSGLGRSGEGEEERDMSEFSAEKVNYEE